MNYIGYTPYPWQRDVHKALATGWRSGNIYVVLSRRQCGKSAMVEQELLRYAIEHCKTTSFCISPTLSQSRKIFAEILEAIKDSGVVAKSNESLLEIKLINKSAIVFKSAEQKQSLRGYTCDGILCIDECAFIPDEIFYIVLPWVNVHKAPILMTSSPRFKQGFFYEYYTLGMSGENPNVKSFNFCTYDTSVLLPESKLEEYRKILPRLQFMTEFEGRFIDGESLLFADFKKCLYSAYVGSHRDSTAAYMGIDWGSGAGQDYTAISILNEKGEQIYVEAFNRLGTKATIDKIEGIYKRFQHLEPEILAECNSIGKPFIDLLKDRGIKVKSFVTSNSSKAELVSDISLAFEKEEIKIINHEEQVKQLSMYEAQVNPRTGSVSYNAPVGYGYHDDCVIALMLSYKNYKDHCKNDGVRYAIRYGKKRGIITK